MGGIKEALEGVQDGTGHLGARPCALLKGDFLIREPL